MGISSGSPADQTSRGPIRHPGCGFRGILIAAAVAPLNSPVTRSPQSRIERWPSLDGFEVRCSTAGRDSAKSPHRAVSVSANDAVNVSTTCLFLVMLSEPSTQSIAACGSHLAHPRAMAAKTRDGFPEEFSAAEMAPNGSVAAHMRGFLSGVTSSQLTIGQANRRGRRWSRRLVRASVAADEGGSSCRQAFSLGGLGELGGRTLLNVGFGRSGTLASRKGRKARQGAASQTRQGLPPCIRGGA
jgi:hypothetical protein